MFSRICQIKILHPCRIWLLVESSVKPQSLRHETWRLISPGLRSFKVLKGANSIGCIEWRALQR